MSRVLYVYPFYFEGASEKRDAEERRLIVTDHILKSFDAEYMHDFNLNVVDELERTKDPFSALVTDFPGFYHGNGEKSYERSLQTMIELRRRLPNLTTIAYIDHDPSHPDLSQLGVNEVIHKSPDIISDARIILQTLELLLKK